MKRFKLLQLFPVFVLLVTAAWGAKPADYRPGYRRVSSGSWVQDKNFYLLTLFEQIPAVRAELEAEPTLLATLRAKEPASAPSDFKATVTTMMFSEPVIESVRQVLVQRVSRSAALQALVTEHLRPSGCYIRLGDQTDAEMLGAAWVAAARGLDHVISQFALGTGDPYPAGIDSPAYDPNSPEYQKMILEIIHRAGESARGDARTLFFKPSLDLALGAMALNRRDEPARFEPLTEGENHAALGMISHLEGKSYRYASLLVLGIGPDNPGVALSEGSRANCAVAAKLYREGLAPLVVVSGGFVHPKQTIFCEAIEMKRELVVNYGLPESAILVDPQARHHTTNFRNAARLLFAAAIPADKPSLAISLKRHIDGVLSERFGQRCVEGFGYLPITFGRRIDDTSVEFTPSIESLQIEPNDPLDP